MIKNTLSFKDINIYIVDWKTIYELPIKDVVAIMKWQNIVTED